MEDKELKKFDTLINEISRRTERSLGFLDKINRINGLNSSNSSSGNTCLALIYDYSKCNEYARVIMDKSKIKLTSEKYKDKNVWSEKYNNYYQFSDTDKVKEASKWFIELCEREENTEEKYKFIFWALMILTVDKTDVEKHLSLICEYVKMLQITDEEFGDIVQVIKIIYSGEAIKNRKILPIFRSALNILYFDDYLDDFEDEDEDED